MEKEYTMKELLELIDNMDTDNCIIEVQLVQGEDDYNGAK